MTVEVNAPSFASLLESNDDDGVDDFNIGPYPGGTGGSSSGGSSSGGSSSSGSSSSGGSSAPSDPYTAWYTDLDPIEKKRVSLMDSTYTQLMGEPAPLAILQQAVGQGLSTSQFRQMIVTDDAFWTDSTAAQEVAAPYDNLLLALGLEPVFQRKKGKGKGGGGKGDGKGGKGVNPGGDAQPPKGGRGGHPGGVGDDQPPNWPVRRYLDIPNRFPKRPHEQEV